MELEVHSSANNLLATRGESQVGSDEQVQELICRGSLDFASWALVISKIEKTYPDNDEKISLAYDSFLAEFPLCYGYWRKYAAQKARLCTVDKVVEIFERAVQSATYCVSVWVDYCSFSMSTFEDPSDVRRLFKRAMSFVGKDYLCHPLWDKYTEFESSQQEWSLLAQIYVQTLKFPTKKLHNYYDNFKQFVAILEEDMKGHINCIIESQCVPDDAIITPGDEVSCIIDNLMDPSTGSVSYKALLKYKSIGNRFYQEACELEKKIHSFETNIRRPYFHVMPLDDSQLENWHRYLDFVEMQDDFDWAVKFYERCLISCAGYPEFWMRYIDYVESKGGREIANFALDRAKDVFLKNVPAIHFFYARYKEQIADIDSARAAFLWTDNELSSCFVEKVVKEANMEKRMGNFTEASSVYEKSLEMAAERQKLHSVPVLYIHYCHLKYMMTGSVDAARDVIIDGIQHVPHCKILLEGLITFLMAHGGQGQVDAVDNIIADAISAASETSQALSWKDREDISVLYLQFVDQCGTIHDVRKAWNRHMKLFPHFLRTTSLDKYLSSSCNQLLHMLVEVRETNHSPLSDEPSGGQNSDHLTQLQRKEQRLASPGNGATHPSSILEDHFQPADLDSGAQERLQQLSPKVADHSIEDGSSINKSTHDPIDQAEDDATGQMEVTLLVNQSGEDANEQVESTHGSVQQPGDGGCGLMESNQTLVHDSGGDAPEPVDSTHASAQCPGEDTSELAANNDTFSGASQEHASSINMRQDQDHTPEKYADPLSLDGLSLNSQDNSHEDSMPMSYEHQAPPSNKMPGNSQNANGSPSKFENESLNPMSMGSHDNPQPEQVQLQQQVPTDGIGNWHHRNNAVRTSKDARSRFRRDSQEQWNQRRKISSHAQMGAQKHTNQGYPVHPLSGNDQQNQDKVGSSQGNIMATHSWSTQNLQQQNVGSQHQLQPSSVPASHPQAQMPQFSTYNQPYNQMMGNYLQQQQQMILQQHYQQQQQYMQQLQQQVQQPYQQQPPHMAPQQYQHYELQMQQHQQLMQLYYQQSPQLQEQQAQVMQQQLLLTHQQQGQLYHQYMQLQEQYQQQGYQIPQQNQQQHHHHEQSQEQQQTTSVQIPMWNGSYYPEGQQVLPPHTTLVTAEASHFQQPRVVTPPCATNTSESALLPYHNQQAPSRATSPPNAGATGSSTSPFNQQ